MRFFIFLILFYIIMSSIAFGFGDTMNAIYGEHTFWGISITILIVIYMLISSNKNNYGGKNDTFSF